eukprot:UN28938
MKELKLNAAARRLSRTMTLSGRASVKDGKRRSIGFSSLPVIPKTDSLRSPRKLLDQPQSYTPVVSGKKSSRITRSQTTKPRSRKRYARSASPSVYGKTSPKKRSPITSPRKRRPNLSPVKTSSPFFPRRNSKIREVLMEKQNVNTKGLYFDGDFSISLDKIKQWLIKKDCTVLTAFDLDHVTVYIYGKNNDKSLLNSVSQLKIYYCGTKMIFVIL